MLPGLNMPGTDGCEVLDAPKPAPGLTSIPVILFSTSLNMKAIEAGYRLGANYYARKPVS